jgi:hypothetical protein
MFYPYLTLLTALALASVAGWFSIIGIMTIYAAGPVFALILGVATEIAKLVTASWLYREWEYTGWLLKIPLTYFVIALMGITSIGVFGFLSKLHLEQGSNTIDNAAKVERLDQQILREQTLIAANDKIITQLDATLDSLIRGNRADRSVVIRNRQAPQRNDIRTSSYESQKRINALSDEKFTYGSEIRKLELDVGPLRYIAQLIYGNTGDTRTNIESAVMIFTLIIVSSLDPLAVLLLIAANQTLLRRKNEKEKAYIHPRPPTNSSEVPSADDSVNYESGKEDKEAENGSTLPVGVRRSDFISEISEGIPTDLQVPDPIQVAPDLPLSSTPEVTLPYLNDNLVGKISDQVPESILETPDPISSNTTKVTFPYMNDDTVLREFMGAEPHFSPERLKEVQTLINEHVPQKNNKYPTALGWLTEFKRQ